jgi:hypothetical protein
MMAYQVLTACAARGLLVCAQEMVFLLSVCLISRDGLHSVIRMCTEQNQKWYSSQKKWYFSHFAKTQKEIHTLSPEPEP